MFENTAEITIYTSDEIEIAEYDVLLAETDEEKVIGLSEHKQLDDDNGMFFYYEEPQTLEFTMEDTDIDLDIIFIDKDLIIKSIFECKANSKDIISEDDVQYVLEIKHNPDIKVGQLVDVDGYDVEDLEDEKKLQVLDNNGDVQMIVGNNAVIFSRKDTKVIARKSKKAYNSKNDNDYKALGKFIFKKMKINKDRGNEYV